MPAVKAKSQIDGSLPLSPTELTGPATAAAVLAQWEQQVKSGQMGWLRAIPTGFQPLDDILNGGLRPGELMLVGGPQGVGKTIFGLQAARNAVLSDPACQAMYVCYEHDRTHMLMRLLCLESAQQGLGDDALNMRRLSQMMQERSGEIGLVERLRRIPRYAAVLDALAGYADRLVLVKASGEHSSLESIAGWIKDAYPALPERFLLVVDYLQKIPVLRGEMRQEDDAVTYLAQGLKELAMRLGIAVLAVSASDRAGLKSRRMRLEDMRGSSAVQYEADIGLILNNKHSIVSREHMVYNLAQAEAMRNWIVLSVEKNRAGRNAVDMEHILDGAHFRIAPGGEYVRDRLIDERVVTE